MPATEYGWRVTPAELESWIVEDTPELVVVNKPPLVVCHPSKHGPWSSLVGACREYFGLERLVMPSRLDRETSGVVVLAKTADAGSRLGRAVYNRRVRKEYWAVLSGTLRSESTVDAPIGRDSNAVYINRQCILTEGRPSVTVIEPVAHGGGWTLARVHPHTGRLHQIRVHAAHIGHGVAGDKLYPDARWMMEFVKRGWTEEMAAALPLRRHALHAAEVVYRTRRGEETFRAPLAGDIVRFCRERLGVEPEWS